MKVGDAKPEDAEGALVEVGATSLTPAPCIRVDQAPGLTRVELGGSLGEHLRAMEGAVLFSLVLLVGVLAPVGLWGTLREGMFELLVIPLLVGLVVLPGVLRGMERRVLEVTADEFVLRRGSRGLPAWKVPRRDLRALRIHRMARGRDRGYWERLEARVAGGRWVPLSAWEGGRGRLGIAREFLARALGVEEGERGTLPP